MTAQDAWMLWGIVASGGAITMIIWSALVAGAPANRWFIGSWIAYGLWTLPILLRALATVVAS